MAQLSDRLFSSSDVLKKLSHLILLNFLFGMVFSFNGSETHFDIFYGGHRYPYQMENIIKLGGIDSFIYTLGLNNSPGAVIAVASPK